MTLLELKKQKKISSEKLFNIIKQPKDTCPLIDKVIDFQNQAVKQLGKVYDVSCELPFNEECESCSLGSKLESFLDKLAEETMVLPELIDTLKQSNVQLESYRNQCEEFRGMNTEYKQRLWSILNEIVILGESYSISPAGLQLLGQLAVNLPKPQIVPAQVDFKSIAEQLKQVSNSLNEVVPEEGCKECDNSDVAEEVKEAISKMKKMMPEAWYEDKEKDLTEALQNYQNLMNWSKELLAFSQSLQNNPEATIKSLMSQLK